MELNRARPVAGAVELRSDTFTRPSAEMRAAMAAAEVGDDVYGEDPTVNRLEARAAEIFGKEAALFVPSGCMGNLVAIKVWTHHGDEVICEERGHVNLYELASMSAVAGCMPRIARADDGILNWEQIEAVIRPQIYYDSQPALICLENTVNMWGGLVYPTAQVDEICDRAHERGLKVHMDGARIFNAATALGEKVSFMTRKVDSVMFCLSKGLGAPVGSMVVGTREFIEKARVYRKMYGGGMRQAGVIAAAGLSARGLGRQRWNCVSCYTEGEFWRRRRLRIRCGWSRMWMWIAKELSGRWLRCRMWRRRRKERGREELGTPIDWAGRNLFGGRAFGFGAGSEP